MAEKKKKRKKKGETDEKKLFCLMLSGHPTTSPRELQACHSDNRNLLNFQCMRGLRKNLFKVTFDLFRRNILSCQDCTFRDILVLGINTTTVN